MARFIKQGIVRNNSSGTVENNATITVYLAGTTTAATIYSTSSGGTAISGGQVTSNANGYYRFYIDNKDYKERQLFDIVVTKSGETPVTYPDIDIIDTYVDSVNVMDYGADNTGVALSNQAFLDAQDDLTSGGCLIVPPGTYLLDAVTTATLVGFKYSNIHMIGYGATLKAQTTDQDQYRVITLGKDKDDSGDTGLDTVENIVLEGFVIQGDRDTHTGSSGEAGMGVWVTNSRNSRVLNCEVKDCWGDGIYVDYNPIGQNQLTTPYNVLIDHCYCHNNRRNNLSILNVDGIVVQNSKFYNANGTSPEAGIDVEPDFYQVSGEYIERHIRIINNEVIGNEGGGIEIVDTSSGRIEDILVQGNVVRGNGNTRTGGIRAITKKGNGSIRIVDNEIWDNYRFGIALDGADGAAPLYNIIVRGNHIKGTLEATYDEVLHGDGIIIQDQVAQFLIDGNIIELNDYHGIWAANVSSTVVEGLISNNLIYANSQKTDDTYSGIRLTVNTSGITVSNNLIRKTRAGLTVANEQKYGIHVSTNGNNIIGNDLIDSGKTANLEADLAVIIDDDTSRTTVIKNNRGFVNENAVRSGTFAVDTTGTGTLTIAHGLDTKQLGVSAHTTKLLAQASLTFFKDTIAGTQPEVTGFLDDIDATNVTVKYTVVTGTGTGGDVMRAGVTFMTPNVN